MQMDDNDNDGDSILEKPIQWGLDPLFHVYVKIVSSMLTKMVPGNWGMGDSDDQPVYFYKFASGTPYRPVRLVQLCGVLVRLESNSHMTRFVLDDNSSCTNGTNCANFQCFGKLEWRKGVPSIVASTIRVAKFARAVFYPPLILYFISPTGTWAS